MKYSRRPSAVTIRTQAPFLGATNVALLTGLSLLIGCQRPTAPSPASSSEAAVPSPVSVTVVHPERKTVTRIIKRPGYNVEPFQRTAIYARVSGYVGKWHFDIGDRVRKGDVMAELSAPEMDVDLQQREAAVAQSEAEVLQAKSAALRAQAEYGRTKSQYERLSKVGQSGVIDRENVEETRFGFEAAEAGVAKAHADVKSAEARVTVSQKSRDYTRTLLEYVKIRAPFDGVVTQRNVSEGDFIQPSSSRKGDALFVVDQIDPVRVFISVPEGEAVWLKTGIPASVRIQSLPGLEFKGAVTRTAKSLDPATRTLRTEIDLPNPVGELLPGMFVDVAFVAEHKDVWTLPASAIATEEEQTVCFQIEDGKAVRIPVQVGLRNDVLVEVVKKNVKAVSTGLVLEWEAVNGKEVIIANVGSGLKHGQAVAISSASKGGPSK